MTKIYLSLMLIFSMSVSNFVSSQNDTIFIDFGDPATTSAAPWNNMTGYADGSIVNLLNSDGEETSYGITVFDAFGGINTGGTQTPDAGIGFEASATRDSYYGNSVIFGTILEPTGGVEFSGLNPEVTYTFVVFASRASASDVRESKYIFRGFSADSANLDAANNTGNTITVSVKPTVEGTIKLTVTTGPNNTNANGFFYLGAMQMIYQLPEPPKDTISIDFGDPTIASASPWNNMSSPDSGTAVSQLLNQNGIPTSIGIMVKDAFGGYNTAGTDAADASFNFPATATKDSYYGCDVVFGTILQSTGGVEISNLNPDKDYTFEIFASRMSASDNRETQYDITGNTSETLYLDAANNTANMVSVTMKPKANGTVYVAVSPGPNNTNANGFFYMGTMRIMYEQESTQQVILTAPNGGEFLHPGNTYNITWASSGLTEVIEIQYSTDNGANWNPIETVASDVTSYEWEIPSVISTQCLVSLTSGDYSDQSDNTFTISDDHACTIVVLGSSTAVGTGTSIADSAWVKRYTAALKHEGAKFTVVNLAVGGYTTYQILPTGTTITGVSETIDANHNVTKALTYNPYAIIINMPSNDANKYYTVAQQLENYKIINDYASASGINVWIASPQPRNFTNATQIQIQKDMVDTLPKVYGDYVIDFWTGIATSEGKIVTTYDCGDGIHLNNAGHGILFERVWEKRIDTLNCNNTTSVFDSPKADERINAYPNPFNEEVTFELESASAGNAQIEIFDALGRLVYQQNLDITHSGTQKVTIQQKWLNTTSNILFGIVTVNDSNGNNHLKMNLIHVK